MELDFRAKQAQKYSNDIIGFTERVLVIHTLLDFQKDALIEMAENPKVVITACHDVGKTFMLAIFLLWGLYTHPSSTVIATAPTSGMMKNLLWREVRRLWRNAPEEMGGRILDTRIEVDGEKWYALGISPKNENTEDQRNFIGFHNAFVFVLFDEGPRVPPERWKDAKTLLTSDNVWFVAIGNPASPTGPFKEACDSPLYKVIKLSCFNSPNLVVNGIKTIHDVRAEGRVLEKLDDEEMRKRMSNYKVAHGELMTFRWCMEQFIEEGEESSFFQSRVLGNFPKESAESLVSYAAVENAMNGIAPYIDGPVRAGVDVARFGNDLTVCRIFKGNQEKKIVIMSKRDTVEVTEKLLYLIKEDKIEQMAIDDTGLNGVTDQVESKKTGCSIFRYISSARASDPEKYINLRAESYDFLGKDIKRERLILLEDKKTLTQLPAMNYKYKDAKLQIESKDDIKKRIGRSPDHSDALCMVNYIIHINFGGKRIEYSIEFGETIDEGY